MSTDAGDASGLRDGPRDVSKKVRLTAQEAALLARLAERSDTTESEILREGIRLQRRMERRAENIGQLIDLIEGDEPEKIRFQLDG